MNLSKTKKISSITLLLYWPLIFILTHIPLKQPFLQQLQASDKTLHFLVYFILSFLLYFAVESAAKKLSLKSRNVWLSFSALLFYAAADEWLQGLVGRSRDFLDFVANLTGVLAAFALLSFLSFRPALLLFTAVSILVITKAAQMRFTGRLSFIKPTVYSLAYAFFTIIWYYFTCFIGSLKNSATKRLIVAFALPLTVLLAAVIFSFALGSSFQLPELISSLAAIFAVAAIFYLTISFRQKDI